MSAPPQPWPAAAGAPEAALPDLQFQHVQEATFLAAGRDHLVRSPRTTLARLVEKDEVLDAHLDGLRLAGDRGWSASCRELETWKGPGEVFVAGVLALERDEPAGFGQVLDLAALAPPDSGPGFVPAPVPAPVPALVSALGWLPFARVATTLEALLRSPSAAHRHLGLRGALAHRQDPWGLLPALVEDPDPRLRAGALRAIGELGCAALAGAARAHLGDPDEACRFRAAGSTLRFSREPAALQVLQDCATSGAPFREAALELALRRLEAGAARAWLRSLAAEPASLRLAVLGAGHLGEPDALPWLLELMATAPMARVALDAFTTITGADPGPRGGRPGTTEPGDDPPAEDPDDDLPWPERARVESWWLGHRGAFTPGARHLLGRRLDGAGHEAALRAALREGRQRHRTGAALEWAFLAPGRALFEVRAPGFRQLDSMEIL